MVGEDVAGVGHGQGHRLPPLPRTLPPGSDLKGGYILQQMLEFRARTLRMLAECAREAVGAERPHRRRGGLRPGR